MTTFERLEQSAYKQHIELYTNPLPVKGLYYADKDFAAITLSTRLKTESERCEVLAHELGHHYTCPPNLFEASKGIQGKYELKAAVWAVKTLMPPSKLLDAWEAGIRDEWELAEYLDVTVPFLRHGLEIYEEVYGQYIFIGKYCMKLRPVEVFIA